MSTKLPRWNALSTELREDLIEIARTPMGQRPAHTAIKLVEKHGAELGQVAIELYIDAGIELGTKLLEYLAPLDLPLRLSPEQRAKDLAQDKERQALRYFGTALAIIGTIIEMRQRQGLPCTDADFAYRYMHAFADAKLAARILGTEEEFNSAINPVVDLTVAQDPILTPEDQWWSESELINAERAAQAKGYIAAETIHAGARVHVREDGITIEPAKHVSIGTGRFSVDVPVVEAEAICKMVNASDDDANARVGQDGSIVITPKKRGTRGPVTK